MQEATPVKQIRHIFHGPTSGWDTVFSYAENSGDPCFAWSEKEIPENPFPDQLTLKRSRRVGSLRKAGTNWLRSHPAELTVYHDGIGIDIFAAVDAAPHKMTMLHERFVYWQRHLEYFIRFGIGVLYDHQWGEASISKGLPWVPQRFIHHLPTPAIDLSFTESASHKNPSIGIVLSLESEKQYRNRLRAFLDVFRSSKSKSKIRIICFGSGKSNLSKQAWLEADFVSFQKMDDWTSVQKELVDLDFVIQLDDRQPFRPFFLKSLNQGAFLFIPDEATEIDLPRLDEEGAPNRYESHEFGPIPAKVKQWTKATPDDRQDYFSWADQLCKGCSTTEYQTKKQELIQFLSNQRPLKFRRKSPNFGFASLKSYLRKCRLRSLGRL